MYSMSKAKVSKIAISLALVLVLAGGCIGCGASETGSITDQSAKRAEGEPSDGIVYIEPEMVSLANSVSGTDASVQLQRQLLIVLMLKGRVQGFQHLNGIPVLSRRQQLEQWNLLSCGHIPDLMVQSSGP